MPGIRALGVFCDDVRDEASGTQTLVGVYPDNLNVPKVPAGIPKLTLYVRVSVDPYIDIDPISIWYIFPDGEERQVIALDPEVVSRTQADVRKSGAPFATVISRAMVVPFPVMGYGRLKAVLRTKDEELVCAFLNFQPVVSTDAPATQSKKRRTHNKKAAPKASTVKRGKS